MATSAQVTANRANALHSTGPRTEEGKARSAANSFKHGFFSKAFIVSDDEQADFDTLVASLEQSLRPDDIIAEDLFAQLLHATWNLHRLRRLENEIYAGSVNPLLDDGATQRLELLARHRVRFERSRRAAMKELREHTTGVCNRFGLPVEGLDDVPLTVDVHRVHKTRREMFRAFPREAFLDPEQKQQEQEEEERRERERATRLAGAMADDGRLRYADGTLAPEGAFLYHAGTR